MYDFYNLVLAFVMCLAVSPRSCVGPRRWRCWGGTIVIWYRGRIVLSLGIIFQVVVMVLDVAFQGAVTSILNVKYYWSEFFRSGGRQKYLLDPLWRLLCTACLQLIPVYGYRDEASYQGVIMYKPPLRLALRNEAY